jgi:antitoxin ParD1/3/4
MMEIKVSYDIEQIIAEKVNSGEFETPEQVVERAVRLLHERDREMKKELEALLREIQKGVDDIESGHGIELTDEVFEEIVQEARAELVAENRESA